MAIADRGFDLATGQRGGVLGGINRNLRDRTQTRARRIRGGISNITQGRRRGTGFIGAGRRAGNSILNRLLGITERSIDVDYRSGNPDLARPGVFTGWQGEVIRKFNQIIIIMRDAVPVYMTNPRFRPDGRGPSPTTPGGRYAERIRSGRQSRTAAEAAAENARISRLNAIDAEAANMRLRRSDRNDGRRARVFAGRIRQRTGSAISRFGRIGRGLGGRFSGAFSGLGMGIANLITGDDYLMGGMADTYMDAGTNYMAPIGPLPLNSRDPYAENFATGGYDPRMISDLTPQMRENRLMDRYNRRMAYRRSFGGRMSGLRRGLGRGVRGLGRLGGPLAGAALTAFSLASLFGGDANAGEMEGMTAEDQRQMRRDRNRQVLGGLAGIAGGAAGGALLGSAFGPVGTVLGGVLGGFLGEEAVKSLSDPIIDGIGDFAGKVGDFFKGLWGGAVNLVSGGFDLIKGGIKNLMWFFGSEGPIMTVARFMVDLPGNIIGKVKEGFEAVGDGFKGLGQGVINAIGNFFNPDKDGKALGGVGTGLTLVGENGPELVNLGTGSVVTPRTSFAGLGLNRGQQAPTINNVVINVNAPGADEFAQTLTVEVIDKLEEMYKEQKALQGGIS